MLPRDDRELVFCFVLYFLEVSTVLRSSAAFLGDTVYITQWAVLRMNALEMVGFVL